MLIKTIFSGFGGQGVLSMGQTLANAAMIEGKYVTYLPTYGTEVRGGTANCTVTISDEEIASPIASEPDFVVAMNKPSFLRFQNMLRPGGFLLYNSSLVSLESPRDDIDVDGVPVMKIASELGNSRVTNMVMFGAFVEKSDLVSIDLLMENLLEILGAKKAKLLDANKEAIQVGFNYKGE